MAMGATTASAGIVDRMIRAARLDAAVYEEVERDTTATTQAATVVVIGAVASGIGTLGGGAGVVESLIAGIIGGLIGWAVYAYVAYLVGTKLLPSATTHADWGEVARTLGFASAPRALLVFGFIPGLGGLIALVVGIWVLVATIVAVRAALDMTTGRAIVVAVVSWIALALVQIVLASLARGAV